MRSLRTTRLLGGLGIALALALAAGSYPAAQAGASAPKHDGKYKRLLISNAMVIYGAKKAPFGPVDILVEDGLIARVGPPRQGETADAVIDATGKYVMPGLVNTHMHWHESRVADVPQPIQYERNLYLATGTTTTREVGGNTEKSKVWRAESAAGKIVAPRILVWNRPNLGNRSPEAIRAGVRQAKTDGFDGLKIGGLDRDQLEALLDEAGKQGLCTTTHIGVEETTAQDYIDLGVCSIEHFYGVADAAIDGIQDVPANHNGSNEIHRFGRAGELYAQANPDRLKQVVEQMVEKGIGWSPTMSIYEASRDPIRNQHVPWFKDFLHPSMELFFRPSLDNHGSYFLGWTTAQEAQWKRMYRIWMDALRHFGIKGGLITTGDDAGYIHSLYGFGMIRELELHEEAGFHPLEVIQHATANGAKMVGLGDRLGRVRPGYIADLLVVNGNPLQNLRVLNPYGVDVVMYDGKPVDNYSSLVVGDPKIKVVRGGGIEWTIRDGIPYHVPTMVAEIKDIVSKDRQTFRSQLTTEAR